MLSGLGDAARGLKIGGAIAGAVSAVGGLGLAIKSVKKAASMEQLEVAFEVLTGSATRGKKAIEDLMQFSDATPLQADEVVAAGRSLLAFGVGADDVVRTLKMVGEVSQGIGAPLGDIAEIYGKARVQGRLFGEDINQLTGRGIPIVTELAKVLGTSAENVKGLVTQGKVGFPELEKAFASMTGTGGQFEGLMEKQARTFSGLMSTLAGKINGVLRGVGKGLMESLKPVVNDLLGLVAEVGPVLVGWGKAVGEGVSLLVTAFKAGALPGLMKDGLVIAAKSMVNTAAAGFKGIVGALMAALAQIPKFFVEGMKTFTSREYWGGIKQIFLGIGIGLAAGFINALPDWIKPEGLAKSGRVMRGMGSGMIEGGLGQMIDSVGRGLSPVMEKAKDEVAAAFKSGVSAEDLWDVSGNKARMKETVRGLQEVIDKRKEEVKAAEESEREKAGLVKPDAMGEGPLAAMMGRVKPAVSSLGRIGGASLRSGRVERMDRERNALLKQIKENTGRGTVAVYS
jgi:tape measure domain-containing protein